jgi:hypothetical protein
VMRSLRRGAASKSGTGAKEYTTGSLSSCIRCGVKAGLQKNKGARGEGGKDSESVRNDGRGWCCSPSRIPYRRFATAHLAVNLGRIVVGAHATERQFHVLPKLSHKLDVRDR